MCEIVAAALCVFGCRPPVIVFCRFSFIALYLRLGFVRNQQKVLWLEEEEKQLLMLDLGSAWGRNAL